MATTTTTSANVTGNNAMVARPALSAIDWIALVLMIVGGLNWGLVGAFNFDLVAAIFGQMTTLSRIVYVLVGLAAIWGIALAIKLGSNSR